ncbi:MULTISPECIES: DNA polymerase IV [unclassified Rhizobium]|uniref:DNA polymerase IV n=1 Tax=unclassified Rhizobium TaxID=2613769 RepID=UPI000DDF2004|nr:MULTISPECIES: DNA polymerase IV [unclassified Rhizobium]MBB3289546.1 DNA polymerase-4 [Rhizobium sp. BK252]MBB3404488.1 DNA polymerase-4 [Rhizobium sp. BK289]MBB3416874.1 DNA polymerase-4 [Rhizobium sp. BK284]MBB3484751.1 DNA polymerase-4 [Rhizobium sp. BK347]MDK4718760.1 DNA polymerase IV [Rhizobium sp. CNPSo 3968]
MNDMSSTPVRKIIHVDMDAFYASVEQRDNPELRGKPLAVGGSAARGVVAAASYEARAFGVRSAMPSVTAKRKCPDLIFVPPRFDVYKAVSQQIREIFAEYTPLIEPLSLDEAYLDVTENLKGMEIATEVALEIRARIKQVTGLNASAGISYNKFLAKMASDLNKPNGQAVITPKNGPAFVEALPVGKFHGVGPATAERMRKYGIETGLDLKAKSLAFLQEHFGKSGSYFYGIARGIDERQVRPDRIRKSVGAEDTFPEDIDDLDLATAELRPLAEKVWHYCEASGISGKTVTVKIKYSDFTQATRSRTIPVPVAGLSEILEAASALLATVHPFRRPVRLLGVTLSSLTNEETDDSRAQPQLDLGI